MSGLNWSVGVDIGGTNIKLGVADEDGRIVHRRSIPTRPARGSDAILASLIHGLEAFLSDCSLHAQELVSIGLGVPGTADAATGTVVYAPNLFWRNVEIVPSVQRHFHVPVFLAQDTRAAAWAEYLAGTGQGLRGLAAVTLGTGIGCGMVLDGKIFHGALNTAGEFGHQIVEIDGELCNCGRRGCLEAHAGGLAILRQARKRIPDVADLLDKDPAQVTVDDVYRLAQQGNSAACELTESVVRYVGIGLVNLINLNSLELICLSGGISNAPRKLLLDPLIGFVRERAYESIAERVQIRNSILRDEAPLIGAALLHRATYPAPTMRSVA